MVNHSVDDSVVIPGEQDDFRHMKNAVKSELGPAPGVKSEESRAEASEVVNPSEDDTVVIADDHSHADVGKHLATDTP